MIVLVIILVVVIRLIEIVFDLIIGGVIDNIKLRWGKFCLWFCIGGIVSVVCLVMLFINFFGLVISN